MKTIAIAVTLLLLLSPGAPVPNPEDWALVCVDDPTPATAAGLLSDGIMVVRDMGSYLVAATGEREFPRLDQLGLAWEVLDPSIEGKTYYTVAYREPRMLEDVGPPLRVLKAAQNSAVIEATPSEAGRVAAAGLDIAAVFLRPIRPSSEHGVRPARAPATYDPRIQSMVDAVSGSNVDAYVQRLQDFRTRYSLHDSCAAAARYIGGEFESFGLDTVFFHHFQDVYSDNVVAVWRGESDPDRQIIIGGHYDSNTADIEDCPGADDNASGTSCVLECARVLSKYRFESTILFITFCGEEQGLRGSEAYAADAAARGDDIVAMVNVDMIGYVAPADEVDLYIIDDANSQWIRDRAVEVAGLYVPELPVVAANKLLRGSSDHASFRAYGYDAILFHEDVASSTPYIHTVDDVVGLSYNAPDLAKSSVKTAVALIADLAGPIGLAKPELVFTLDQNYPNPFNGGTTIRYSIAETSPVRLRVYDVAGRLVKTLVDEVRSPRDENQVTWDGRNDAGQPVASGVYFYRIVTRDFDQTRKLVLLK